jgi:ABC-type multidrug transport system fused ATPase/permease subunit
MSEEKVDKKLTSERLKITFNAVFRYLKTYKNETILLSVLAIVSALGNGTIPYISGHLFDSLISPNNTFTIFSFTGPLFIGLLALWLVIQIITSLADWKIEISSLVVSNSIWSDYMSRGIGKILLMPISFHKENNSSSLVHQLDMSASGINLIFNGVIIKLTPKFLSIFVSLIICFLISSKLSLILISGLVIFSIVITLGVRPLMKFQGEFWEKLNQVWTDFSGVLENTKTVKHSNTEKYEQERLDKQFFGFLLPSFIKLKAIKVNIGFYQKFIVIFTQFVIFCFSLTLVINHQISIGDLLAFNAYTALAFGPLVELGLEFQDIIGATVDISKGEKIFNTPTENYQPKDYIKLNKIDGNIFFKNVDFHYDKKVPVLKKISFEVKAGEVIALVGESGVGKSTMIEILSGYHFPTSGEVTIDNVPIEKIDLNFLRKNIAVVPQEVILFNDSIKKNVTYGSFNVSEDELKSVADKTGITDFIGKLPEKWETLVGERGVKLSVGQKQKVAIARAMLRNPKILILDEPTSALDAGSEKIITDSLEELMKGKTTFIIAHRLSTVKRANKILVFKNGEIIESGTHLQLLKIKDGEYKRLYELQIGLHK